MSTPKASSKKSKAPNSNSNSSQLTFRQTVNAPPAEAFRAFTHATLLRDWLCDAAQTDPRKGGRVYLWWNDGYYACGAYTVFEPGRKIAFGWDGYNEPGVMSVSVTFKEKNGATVVTLAHNGIGSGKMWADTRRAVESDWPSLLENLKSVLEAGIDLRVARRPRLGIFIERFDAAIVKEIGAPVKDGIRLGGTAEGSGARAAGLQKDDVIVRFAGKQVNAVTLGGVAQNFKAGDTVPVVFYRGAEKKTAMLELSSFPIPEVPATGAELAETARKNYEALDSELENTLAGLTESEADHKAGNEWSVKELIAHLTAAERDFQSWVADMLNDTPIEDDIEMRPNVDVRLRAMVERFGTLAALLNELKQAQAETVSLLASLPPALVARKHLYRRAALWMLEVVPGHYREEHSEQLRAAIAAAKKA
ncbi:MAG: PDZ domain-containing protein [Chloroflexi bacterium]|nr:PDZ domain-containing protein [Chloroflexota bacterium]